MAVKNFIHGNTLRGNTFYAIICWLQWFQSDNKFFFKTRKHAKYTQFKLNKISLKTSAGKVRPCVENKLCHSCADYSIHFGRVCIFNESKLKKSRFLWTASSKALNQRDFKEIITAPMTLLLIVFMINFMMSDCRFLWSFNFHLFLLFLRATLNMKPFCCKNICQKISR